ncbi:MAG TPA: geranylgeranyl reductase family protein [Vicinamibacterales bacterium]|nr:geranylgeranyl reductase family protein [Vicinamibacterales bacterium]
MSDDFDVIVVGAGPAGSVAALRLAQAGRRVLLCDRAAFPRDKTCGDGLIADALAVLRTLGLDELVRSAAYRSSRLLTISPGGVEVRFQSTFLVLPRRRFDQVLFEHAVAAGAQFQQLIVDGPARDGDRVFGVQARRPVSHSVVQLRAPLTVLATGAEGGVLRKFDERARVSPSGLAVRTYARLANGADLTDLIISLERDLLPGYAWAFPAPDGLMNVGVGALSGEGLRSQGINLRARLDALLAGKGRLGSMLGPMQAVERQRGAPLRTGLTGSQLGRPGLAVVGEAGGTTYAVTGEGIGKAMESSMLVADLASTRDDLSSVGPDYAQVMTQRYGARFAAYTTAERWVARPLVADYVARRANKSQWVHERLTGIINERDLPNRIFSARSIWRLLTHA